MGQVFKLKFRDTRPILEVTLRGPVEDGMKPEDAPIHDLSGSTAWKLHILKPDGTKLTRDMELVLPATLGRLRYTWLAADWDTGNAAGFLVVGPTLPPAKGTYEHRMEYEVIGGSSRLTFPNDDYDTLRIVADVGQG